MAQPRPHQAYLHRPYQATDEASLVFQEPPNDSVLWTILNQLARVADKGRALFPPPLNNQNRLWAEFGNFIRQANAYWDGAVRISGSSSGLVYYYAFLNLAKAELMMANSAQIYQARIGHGLSYNPTLNPGLRSDYVTVQPGVFKLLYEHRTGIQLPVGTRLGVTRLLGNVPELGFELAESGLASARVIPAFRTILADATHAWNALYFIKAGFLAEERQPAAIHVRKSYREVDRIDMDSLRRVFGISTRAPNMGVMYEQKVAFTDAGSPDIVRAMRQLSSDLRPYSSGPGFSAHDFWLSPSLMKSRALPMPPDLARYALIFYVSSLVRYRPSALDPVRHPDVAWLIDSFVSQSPQLALLDSTSQMSERSICYDLSGYRS